MLLARRLLYRGLRLLSQWNTLYFRRLTATGRFTLGAGFAAGVVGIDTRINLLYQAFSLAAALLLISSLSAAVNGLRLRKRFQGSRILPRYAAVDTPIRYRVSIKATDDRSLHGFFIEEQLPDPRPSRHSFLHTQLLKEPGVNPIDEALGYPRWRQLVRLGRWVQERDATPLEGMTLQGEQHLQLELHPLRRGYLRLPNLILSRPDPLGLVRTRLPLACEQSLLVLPRRYPVAPLNLPGKRQYQPGGVSLASSIGDSQEFIGLREYRNGDSPRNIHWPSWARSGKPQVKEYQDEFFTRHALILDTFTHRPFDPRFEAAVSVAASLCESIQDGESLLDLMFVGTEAYCFTAGRGLAGTEQFMEILACAQPCSDQSFQRLQQSVMVRTRQLSALVCVLLDFDSPRREMVQALHAVGLPIKVLVITEGEADDTLLEGWKNERPVLIRMAQLAEDLAQL